MKTRKNPRYFSTPAGVGTAYYFKVRSEKSGQEYPVEISFRCTCRHHSLHPESKLLCKPVRSAMRKLLRTMEKKQCKQKK